MYRDVAQVDILQTVLPTREKESEAARILDIHILYSDITHCIVVGSTDVESPLCVTPEVPRCPFCT